MAAGVAVLISDQCGVAEGVEEGGVGRVVEVDEDAMVCALDEMLADTESLRQMGARGPSFAESRYAAGEVAKSFALAYADLLSGSRSAQCRWSDG
jgi:glycosyltransferase involved in cell wall biosynthesis